MNKQALFLFSPDGSEAGGAGNGAPPPQDWEARFKGLQGTLNQTQQQMGAKVQTLESTIAAMTTEAHNWKTQFETLQAQISGKEGEFQKLAQERDQLKAEAATSAKKAARFQALSEFPELFADEAQGLLKDIEDPAAFKTYLKTYSERLGIQANRAVEGYKQGGAPAGGATREPPASRDQLMQQLHDAQRNGDRAKFDQIRDQIMRIDEAKQ